MSSHNDDARKCSNCQTTETAQWRHSTYGHLLCNACGLQEATGRLDVSHLVPERPLPHLALPSIATGISSHDDDARKCSNCQKTETAQWRRSRKNGGLLCNACGLQERTGRLDPDVTRVPPSGLLSTFIPDSQSQSSFTAHQKYPYPPPLTVQDLLKIFPTPPPPLNASDPFHHEDREFFAQKVDYGPKHSQSRGDEPIASPHSSGLEQRLEQRAHVNPVSVSPPSDGVSPPYTHPPLPTSGKKDLPT